LGVYHDYGKDGPTSLHCSNSYATKKSDVPKITVSILPIDNDGRQVFINGSSEPVKKGDWILLTCLAEYPHRIISTPFNSKVRIPRNNA